ncbi:phage major tail protein, TP901-1 family [Thermoanaerobacterium thermosaccharolyticum]|uniref:phage tail tube protein n=1 Tax=Thermoanaerobacterium thermosaccharolyticum TaxID=1517 RepID=UPI003DA9DFC7
MPAVTGVSFIIQVNTGAEETPVWTTVAGQQNATLNREVDEADVTSKDSGGWYEGLPTIRNWSIDFDGLIVENDGGYQALEDAFMNNEILQVQLVTPAGNKYTGKAYLTDFPIEAPYDDAATYSGTLQGTGPLTKTTTP